MANKREKEFIEFITKYKYHVDNDFVCINDVIDQGIVYGLNPVIYNRRLNPEENKLILSEHVRQRFRTILTPEQLSYLCDHNLTSVEFIRRLKEMV